MGKTDSIFKRIRQSSTDSSSNFTIFSIDPGKRNSAWSILSISEEEYRLIDTGMFENTITDPDHINSQRERLMDEVSEVISDRKPDLTVIERYVTRMGRAGFNNEVVNLGIGLLTQAVLPSPTVLVTSTTWKNYFLYHYYNNNLLEVMYTLRPKLTAHQADAIGIGVWASDKILDVWGLASLVGDQWMQRSCLTCRLDPQECPSNRRNKNTCSKWEGTCDTCSHPKIKQVKDLCITNPGGCKYWRANLSNKP